MDTREKIITAEQLPELDSSGEWVTVVGLFDPLTIAQARRLSGIEVPPGLKHGPRQRRLLAVVLDTPDSLLPVEARAELVAALRGVNAVFVAKPETWRSQLPQFCCSKVIEDLEDDRNRTAEFINSVLRRQRNGSCA